MDIKTTDALPPYNNNMENINALIECSVIPLVDDRLLNIKKVCIEGCTSDGNLIRCCLCASWYHTGCVELPPNEAKGFWVCTKCRHISEEMAELRLYIQVLMRQNAEIIETIKQQQDQIERFVSMQTNTSAFLKDIEGKVNDLHQTLCEEEDSEDEYEYEYEEAEGVYVYGDSLIRDMKASTPDITLERAGPYISNVRKAIKKLPSHKSKNKTIMCIIGYK